MTTARTWSRRLLATAALAMAGATAVPAAALAQSDDEAGSSAPVVTTVGVSYSCYVTFPGGETTVPFALNFTATAPERARAGSTFKVSLDPQVWTPDPAFNKDVRNVTVKYRLPSNATLSRWYLTGGQNLGNGGIRVGIDYSARTFSLTAAGPLAASVPFDLPTVTLQFKAGNSGVATTATGGTSLTDPSWRWTRTDLEGVQRPFDCNPASPVTFSSTTIGYR